MPGTKWITGDVITFQRMNQKTVIVQAAEPAIMYAGMLWFDINDDKLKERNAANNAWIERPGVTLAATISGLWTFSRGAAVPFAVAAGSLNVTNLDADLLDGQHRVLKINADHAHSGAGAEGGTLNAAAIAAGILAVARGGTGLGAYAQGGILYISAANTLSRLAPAAANRVLRSTAANALEFGALVVADIPNLTTAKLTDVPAAAWATIFSNAFTIATVLTDHDKATHDALGIAPAAHAPTHKDGGTDELDVSELAGAIGGAGEIPETDGAAVTWVEPDGRYDPKAHVLATTGPHTGTLPLTDLVVGVRGEVIIRGAADWEALGVGVALQALLSGGAGADPYWGAPTPAAHVLNTTGPHTGTLQDSDIAGHAVGEVLAIITCPLSGPFTTTAGAAVVIDNTDMIVNISDFPADAKAILRIVWKNSGNNTNNMDLYDQFGAAPIANSSESEGMAAGVWEISETDAPFTLPAGLKSFQLRLWTSGGTLTVSAAHLQIERAA